MIKLVFNWLKRCMGIGEKPIPKTISPPSTDYLVEYRKEIKQSFPPVSGKNRKTTGVKFYYM